MAIQYEVTKKLRGPTTIRTVGVGTANIQIQSQVQSTAVPLVANKFLEVTIATGGTCMLSVAKEANYNPALINDSEEI